MKNSLIILNYVNVIAMCIFFIQYLIFFSFMCTMNFFEMGMNVGKVATNIINVKP
jgi:hypothetical protein